MRPFFIETTTFPDKDSAKTLSICAAELLQRHKDRNSFRITDNTQGIELQNSVKSRKYKPKSGIFEDMDRQGQDSSVFITL